MYKLLVAASERLERTVTCTAFDLCKKVGPHDLSKVGPASSRQSPTDVSFLDVGQCVLGLHSG